MIIPINNHLSDETFGLIELQGSLNFDDLKGQTLGELNKINQVIL